MPSARCTAAARWPRGCRRSSAGGAEPADGARPVRHQTASSAQPLGLRHPCRGPRGALGHRRRALPQRRDPREARRAVRGRQRRPHRRCRGRPVRRLACPVNATLGTAGIVLGVAASALGIVTIVWGLRKQRPELLETGWSYSLLILLGAVVAVIAMQRALITRDFTVSFVHDNGSSRTPAIFNVATMWSALEGSILLWVLILSGFTVHVARRFRKRLSDPLVGM